MDVQNQIGLEPTLTSVLVILIRGGVVISRTAAGRTVVGELRILITVDIVNSVVGRHFISDLIRLDNLADFTRCLLTEGLNGKSCSGVLGIFV